MVQITLTGLVTTQNADVQSNPVFDNSLLTPTNLPTQCVGTSSILGILKAQPTLDSYLGTTLNLTDTITNVQAMRDSLISSRADTLRPLPVNDSITSVKTYLNSINDRVLPYYRLVNNCITEQKEIPWDELSQQKEGTSESKERYESVKHPEQNVSYYEGWFPIFRPMTETSLFVLFAIGTFFILFSLVFFLRMSGVEFDLKLPFTSDSSSFIESYKPYLYSFGGSSILFAIVIVAVGMNRGWFTKE
jgi:hypothetical protein